ncbi:hypothetical protein TSAR_012865 [Trichomalopsis sarcophagae]|uniref:Uncharacterized protein n=1 Tax=Trichomalopsis sarcophagae TaxID=543379 RepID=A0A232FBX9_9HYME|nr:hypothetical protein TSAR_012865 [Trichomalopsis sarcophagae]
MITRSIFMFFKFIDHITVLEAYYVGKKCKTPSTYTFLSEAIIY